ncbi:PAS domain-containing protein [Bifidobacterium sp. ESL0784]|uniref:helix-turn-helix transcriptional regulator n=1 Tax=Bifidobacterium sp. ESL0784 TaxID=2983231 RepID=UPI0023F8AEC3|nr:PAS domain-containing protein [Bifidobacterium sp. ESL0784]MDF7640797.1 PAS domain-containing protein [Bifidobacterium sp. ESL0784]
MSREKDQQAQSDGQEINGDEREMILAALMQLVDPLSRILPDSEVVLHDLRKMPNTIVAIANSLTGRGVGDPATDLLLAEAAQGDVRTKVSYRTTLPDGRDLQSTTIAIKDRNMKTFAALCINSDVYIWQKLSSISSLMLGQTVKGERPAEENFAKSVDELGNLIIDGAIAKQGIPVELMQKEHKMKVVQDAKNGGVFLLRDAADTMAQKLGVSRFTVYNYLKELDADSSGENAGTSESA